MKTVLTVGFLVLFAQQLLAQPTERLRRNTAYWTSPTHTFYKLDPDQSLWANLEIRYNSPATTPEENYHLATSIGYQHQLNTYWLGGLSFKNAHYHTRQINTLQADIGHYGAIKSLEFVKKFFLEIIDFSDLRRQNMARYSLYVHWAKTFGNKTVKWQPMLAIQFFKKHEWDVAIRTLGDQRFIDLTRISVNLNILLDKQTTISLFVLRQTEYYFAYPTYDEEGNEKQPFRKLNLITPTWGFSIRHVLNP